MLPPIQKLNIKKITNTIRCRNMNYGIVVNKKIIIQIFIVLFLIKKVNILKISILSLENLT